MDNLTHTLTAVALSEAGLNRKTRYATLSLIIAANLPDIDLITAAGGSATYLEYHRGLTHSILGATVLAALVCGAVYFLKRKSPPAKKAGPPLDLRWLALTCWIGTLSHVLLDFTNSYGIRPFEPFSGAWYAWDIMFIIDPVLLGLLSIGLGVPWLFRMISEEVGARKPGYRKGAVFALGAMVLLWGLRDFARRRVKSLLDSHTYGQENPLAQGAFPYPGNPFVWTGIVETESAIHVVPANALDSDVDMEDIRVYDKPQTSPALVAAMKTRTARIFLDFARFPLAEVEDTDEGFEVTIRDLRFLPPTPRRHAFEARIELDKDLRVRSETFSFTGRTRREE